MKRQKIFISLLYAIIFILSCWNWIYSMAICSDIPVNPSKSEFLIAEGTIVIILIINIYLIFKGYPILNYLFLFIPNSIWILNFIQDFISQFHKYASILSLSMIIVLGITFLGNILFQIISSKHKIQQ
jgi:hypothetical protein